MELLSYIFFLEGSFAHHRNFCRGLNSPINLSENRSNRTVNIVLQNIIWSKELSRGARYRSNNAFRSIYLVSKLKFRNVILSLDRLYHKTWNFTAIFRQTYTLSYAKNYLLHWLWQYALYTSLTRWKKQHYH